MPRVDSLLEFRGGYTGGSPLFSSCPGGGGSVEGQGSAVGGYSWLG